MCDATLVIASLGLALGAFTVSQSSNRKAPQVQALPPMPESPKVTEDAAAEASTESKKKVAARASLGRVSTNPTGGLGVLGQAPVNKPTLLGA
jgi:hypothetical protein